MTLPEGVKAFFLLKAANVTEEQEKLARATCDKLTYDIMKSNITKIFGDFSLSNSTVKVEPEYYATSGDPDEVYWSRSFNGRGRGNSSYRGKNSYKNKPSYSGHYSGGQREYKCYKCGSTGHIRKNCPQLHKTEEVHITLMGSNESHKILDLVKESLGMALLDCGCTRTVVGKT